MLEEHVQTSLTNIHPGEVLKNILDEKGISQREFAELIGKASPVISDIIKGKRDINPELAVLFEAALKDIPAIEWLSLQNSFDLERLNQKKDIQEKTNAIREWNSLRTIVNINYLKKNFAFSKKIEDNIPQILSYLNVNTVEEFIEKKDHVISYFSKSDKLHTDTRNLMTWITMVRHESNEQNLTNKYNENQIDSLVKDLNKIFFENKDTTPKVCNTLNKYGIKFIVEQKLDKVPVNGYSFWLGENPTIAVTQRINRLDNFAFVILHELGHIYLHLGQDKTNDFIDTDTLSSAKFEKQANDFASEKLFKGIDYKELFSTWHHPYNSASFITDIANTYSIHRSIVTGQYQHYCNELQLCSNAYSICRNFLEKIS